MAGQRIARTAGAALILGLSLSGPQALGVAAADSGQAGAEHERTGSARDSGAEGRTASTAAPRDTQTPTPQRAMRRGAPIGPSAGNAPAASATNTASTFQRRQRPVPNRAAPRDAAVPVPDAEPAAVQLVPAAPKPNSPVLGTDTPAAAQVNATPQADALAGPPALSTAAFAPALPAAAPTLTAAAPGRILLDTVGQLLSSLPATPITDLLSGSLWLVRRALTAIDTAVAGWRPAICACGITGGEVAGQLLTVTSAVDGTPGSLRAVLGSAADGDVIRFAPTLWHANLALTQGELDVDVSVRIEGSGQTLDAGGNSRIMRLDQPGTTIALAGLTFANGAAPGDPALATAGGAIFAQGVTLNICGSTFTGNSALSAGDATPGSAFAQYGLGGAIAAVDSTVTVHDSVFTGNTAVGSDNNSEQQSSGALGGAIFGENSEIVLLRSQFIRNSALGGSGVTPIETFPSSDGGWAAGGAIYSTGAALTASEVIFTGNSATGGNGLDGSPDNPYGNDVGAGGNASGGALWIQGQGQDSGTAVPLTLNSVVFQGNTATGGSAGVQGSALLATQQGGRGVGGGLGAADWLMISIADVTFQDNLAQGGGAGMNAENSGPNTGTGGVAQGGGAFLDSPASLEVVRLSLRYNTSRGGRGADSAPESGSEAGEGGYSYGGGVFLSNSTGGLYDPVVIPVSIRDSEIVGNRAVGGEKGDGPVPATNLGAGGLAQGGGLDMTSLFSTQLVGVRFIGNAAIAGQGKFAAGGALANPFGAPPAGVDAYLEVLNTFFRGNSAVGGDDAANDVYRLSQAGAFLNNSTGTVISGSRFEGNAAIGGNDTGSGHLGSAGGGAIWSVGEDPTITFFDTTFVGNAALGGRRTVAGESILEAVSGEARGGAISAENGTVTVNGGAFVGNVAVVRVGGERIASGGAIDIPQPPEDYLSYLQTTGARFVFNAAVAPEGPAQGGAVAFNGTAYTDNGSFLAANTARAGRHDGSAYGGGLFLEQTSRLSGTTVLLNLAHAGQGFGGGIALPQGPDVLTGSQTTVAWNHATTAGDDVWSPASD